MNILHPLGYISKSLVALCGGASRMEFLSVRMKA